MIKSGALTFDPENPPKIESYATIIRPGSIPGKESALNTLWVQSIVAATWFTKLCLSIKITNFILYNLGVNTFSTIGNFGDLVPWWVLATMLTISIASTSYSNLLCKFKDSGSAELALLLNAIQLLFFHNLKFKLEEVVMFKGAHVLCVKREDQHVIPRKTRESLELIQEIYYKSTGRELDIRDENEIQQYCQDFHGNNNHKEQLTVLTNAELSTATLPRRTRLYKFYNEGWGTRMKNDFSDAPFSKGIPTLIKAALAFTRWNITIGVQSILQVATGIVALFGITDYILGETSPLITIGLLAIFSAISWSKMLVNKDLKQHLTDRVVRQAIVCTWHGQGFSVNWRAALESLAPGLIALAFIFATSFFYAEKAPLTLSNKLTSIFGATIAEMMGASLLTDQGFLFYFSMAAIVTGLVTAFATAILPFYEGRCSGIKDADESTKDTIKKYPKVAKAFDITTWIDSIFFGCNARFNVVKTIEILNEKYPELIPFLYEFLSKQIAGFVVGVCVGSQALYFCYKTGMDKFAAIMKVYEKIMAAASVASGQLPFYAPDDSSSTTPLLKGQRDSKGHEPIGRSRLFAPPQLRPIDPIGGSVIGTRDSTSIVNLLL